MNKKDVLNLLECVKNIDDEGSCLTTSVDCGECPINDMTISFEECSWSSKQRAKDMLKTLTEEEIFELLL